MGGTIDRDDSMRIIELRFDNPIGFDYETGKPIKSIALKMRIVKWLMDFQKSGKQFIDYDTESKRF